MHMVHSQFPTSQICLDSISTKIYFQDPHVCPDGVLVKRHCVYRLFPRTYLTQTQEIPNGQFKFGSELG